VSNDPGRVTAFAKDQGGLLLKSIGYTHLDPKEELVLYSERFGLAEIERSHPAIRACPIYAQAYIPKRYEYRVMFIGGEILACRIDSQASKKTAVDWRHYDFENVAHSAVELPAEVQGRISAFMEAVGLLYGALDLIEKPNGEFVFLEVNPSGQWEWIAKLAHLPIADTVSSMLARMAHDQKS